MRKILSVYSRNDLLQDELLNACAPGQTELEWCPPPARCSPPSLECSCWRTWSSSGSYYWLRTRQVECTCTGTKSRVGIHYPPITAAATVATFICKESHGAIDKIISMYQSGTFLLHTHVDFKEYEYKQETKTVLFLLCSKLTVKLHQSNNDK